MLCADGWRERWVESTYKGSEQGAWGWTAGKFYGDAEKDKGNVTYLITRGHIYFKGPPVIIRLFFVRCVYYTLICCV